MKEENTFSVSHALSTKDEHYSVRTVSPNKFISICVSMCVLKPKD